MYLSKRNFNFFLRNEKQFRTGIINRCVCGYSEQERGISPSLLKAMCLSSKICLILVYLVFRSSLRQHFYAHE